MIETVKQLIELSVNFFAFFGLTLICYGIFSSKLNSKWPPLENIAQWVEMFVTFIAVLFTAISIYFPANPREPDKISYFTALVVIIMTLIAIIYSIRKRTVLSIHIVNGFAIIGLSGALFRLVSR